MSWQILLGISIFSYSFSLVLQRILMKNANNDPIAYAICTQVLSGIFFAIFTLFHGFHMPNFLAVLPNFLFMIFIWAALNVALFTAFQTIEASEFTILFLTNSIWSVLIAVIFLGEHFTLPQAGGALLISLGVLLVTKKAKHFRMNKGAFLALLCALMAAAAYVNNDYMVRSFDVPSFLIFSYTLPGLAIALFYPKSYPHIKKFLKPRNFLNLCILSVFYTLTGLTLFFAYQVGRNAAQIGVINQTSTIVTVLLSIVILKETSDLWKKLLGVIVGFVGVLLTR